MRSSPPRSRPWEAGAAVIHLHARDDDGRPSYASERFAELVDGIRERGCDAVLNLSTGSGGGTFAAAERYECLDLAPEMGSFDCGSTNFNDWVFENGRPVPGGHGGGVRPQRRRARDRVLRRLARAERARPHRRRRPARAAALPVRARRPGRCPGDARAGRPHAGDAPGRRDVGASAASGGRSCR